MEKFRPSDIQFGGELNADTTETKGLPSVFSDVEMLNQMTGSNEPTHRDQFEQRGLSVPGLETFAINNGTVTVVDGSGKVYVARPNDKPGRSEELHLAIEQLENMGYQRASFHVPTFAQKPSAERK